ncbi:MULTISPECIES: type II secretion system F family protein [unclassified Mesorhizobium]|uniref:type II secretion system F family protein n=1 Tax=unclassified Mesorhizobium TaxID=325217 RepID=UPI000BAEB798|nr:MULTISPECIES: type II secretion system F family protein [unclassified Mesorhizobium]TGT59565.1 type II secretion system F family protein [Mesorhizobium sp. M00.F.Ca.ET.170.01.1.1]AZO13206.1 type II secretion system F family protein [Mesorhizobium sp. M3A.F.Ca.ET.080.04.2.1]PBB86082.1 type II secretion protein F [Mesorhizobium sp. WSM3876]RWB68476.1 MAG: type II secretion system F family protein [Mesorhizobium sp.]RWB91427.1 MAG: type II secretion system F family protein [Mesorhizobium sp.]
MEDAIRFLASLAPTSLMPVAVLLLVLGGGAMAWPLVVAKGDRGEVKRRLKVEASQPVEVEPTTRKNSSAVREKAVKRAQEFYAKSDPENVARLRLKLIQAGYMDPRAVGMFFLIRFAALVGAALGAFVVNHWAASAESSMTSRWTLVILSGAGGYFLPGLVLTQKVREKMREYRNGFPDFMDLMIVCSDAGMSMEAGIERVSKELGKTYPSLSQNLQLVSLELRAGRSLDDALKALADRLSLDEVRSFATLLQQSKELGTSLSGALRVFSDEMRHKRMSLAEEKAHALPAKMSVPVTVCILPVVLMVAIIPIIVKLTAAH